MRIRVEGRAAVVAVKGVYDRPKDDQRHDTRRDDERRTPAWSVAWPLYVFRRAFGGGGGGSSGINRISHPPLTHVPGRAWTFTPHPTSLRRRNVLSKCLVVELDGTNVGLRGHVAVDRHGYDPAWPPVHPHRHRAGVEFPASVRAQITEPADRGVGTKPRPALGDGNGTPIGVDRGASRRSRSLH